MICISPSSSICIVQSTVVAFVCVHIKLEYNAVVPDQIVTPVAYIFTSSVTVIVVVVIHILLTKVGDVIVIAGEIVSRIKLTLFCPTPLVTTSLASICTVPL
jgi:hypothetical protein